MARTTKTKPDEKPAAARAPRSRAAAHAKAADPNTKTPARAGPRAKPGKTEAAPSARPVASPKRGSSPSPAEVQQRAFELYQARGAVPGRDVEDWLTAEAELARKPRSR